MYESTTEALEHLYNKVSDGGFVIVDGYGALPNCGAAVDDFRRMRSITDPIQLIDWIGVFWRKGQVAASDRVGLRASLRETDDRLPCRSGDYGFGGVIRIVHCNENGL